jgi:hypothetical protein
MLISETEQMAICCKNLTLGALSSRNALSVLVGALFKKFGLFFNTPRSYRKACKYIPQTKIVFDVKPSATCIAF